MQLVPYLAFDGNCREAFDFYHKHLGGDLVAMISHEDMQIPDLPDQWKSLIIHARLNLPDAVLMGGDAPPETYTPASGFCVAAQVPNRDEARTLFAALSEGGTIQMPLEEQEWADLFGMCTDRFGVPWMVNCEQNA